MVEGATVGSRGVESPVRRGMGFAARPGSIRRPIPQHLQPGLSHTQAALASKGSSRFCSTSARRLVGWAPLRSQPSRRKWRNPAVGRPGLCDCRDRISLDRERGSRAPPVSAAGQNDLIASQCNCVQMAVLCCVVFRRGETLLWVGLFFVSASESVRCDPKAEDSGGRSSRYL